MKNSRRQFMILSAAGACTLALNGKVQAQAMVAETDPQAAALGYRADASKVDKAKFAKYAAGQKCDHSKVPSSRRGRAETLPARRRISHGCTQMNTDRGMIARCVRSQRAWRVPQSHPCSSVYIRGESPFPGKRGRHLRQVSLLTKSQLFRR